MPRIPRKSKKASEPTLPPSADLVIKVMKAIRGYSIEYKSKVMGQCTIDRRGETPTVVMYATYPNGDYLCWFNDNVKFQLYALVNEKFKHVMEVEACDLPKLIEAAGKLEPDLGK